jgi:Xaa-Pro aminopeptidase
MPNSSDDKQATLSSLEATLPEQLARRRREAAAAWDLTDELVLIGAGEPIAVPGRGDRTYSFHSHSEYLYLTDRERPGGVLAFDPHDGWVDFVVPVSHAEMLWEGAPQSDRQGTTIFDLPGWLQERRGRPVANLGSPLIDVASDAALTTDARTTLNGIRRLKDALELARMREAERCTRAGFTVARETIAPGRSERQVQIELEAEFLRSGADCLAFDTIVGSGPNSAVLHFAPSARRMQAGELVLIDAGAEVRGYASDVTRTYPVSGQFTPQQAELHALVQAAVQAATARCTPGTEFREVHRAAALVIGEGLAEFGLLRGDAETLVDSGAVSLFFPHGIGHMVGLGVRDASEILAGRQPDANVFPGLRVDLPLEAGQAVTIEPGIYFVPALLGDAETRARHGDAVAWDRAEAMLGFGGIRLEHDVLITADGADVLTADIPI